MRFDELLWTCLAPGRYESTDQNITCVLEPQPNETVLMFEIDNHIFRRRQQGVKSCDVLYFYRGPVATKPVLLFVELKGSEWYKGEDQVLNAIRRVLGEIHRDCIGADPSTAAENTRLIGDAVSIRGVILIGGSLPIDRKQRQKELYRETGLTFRYHTETRGKRTDVRADLG